MDVTGKTKDNVKARLDLPEHCRRPELHIQESANNKLLKPKASCSFTMEQKRKICEWVKSLKMPDGYGSNLGKRADIEHGILHGRKVTTVMFSWNNYLRLLFVDCLKTYGNRWQRSVCSSKTCVPAH
ncbi:hypothetical protein RDI58_019841 [Solanum bulbocastanum]|uniref:Uncharacterized protein n=1 Tax=Solanum bulbocastanum TaxID=147425 RepID=A0AAN8T5G4_SOLBU